MLSMDSPFSSFFSISTISLTPSTTHSLEMSNTPPTEAVSTPPEKIDEDGGGRRVCQRGSGQRSAAPAQHRSWISGGSTCP
uniref:Uncharacterized protein n=1 Tax=Sinocyclocheilus grahami TaxID=75366 RepID=A0A672PFM5_SINGR